MNDSSGAGFMRYVGSHTSSTGRLVSWLFIVTSGFWDDGRLLLLQQDYW
jgi:hypothetical protein